MTSQQKLLSQLRLTTVISVYQRGRVHAGDMGASKSRAVSQTRLEEKWRPPAATAISPQLTELCEDMLIEIFSWVGLQELGRITQTCTFFDDFVKKRASLLWARRANASFGKLDRGWRSLTAR